ncbi:hypothetical protein R6Q59_005000 [Mikania micrantha]
MTHLKDTVSDQKANTCGKWVILMDDKRVEYWRRLDEMGKNKSLQNGYMNKILHALDRRQRWQNVRKVLPNKNQGSGKHIIVSKFNENTCYLLQFPTHNIYDVCQNEQETTETRSKKFRIRSLISNEMAKRRGKTNSLKETENDPHPQSETSTTKENKKKKIKCDICAAMLTVSYLRQKGLANENNLVVIEDENQQPTFAHHTGLTKSFSFPLLAPTRRKDFELQQLKHKLRDLKDIQVTKDKFILPMTQWKDVGFPKPMLTRPESFTGSVSLKKKKTLKQKIGFVFKVDARNKEKQRILMDAVFHKIPYGRKSSKNPKKMLKTTSTADINTHKPIKTSSSTGEAMRKYRKLLSQTSTRDKLVQLSSIDHNTKLYIAEDHSSSEKSIHKRIRSLPDINPYDFMHNQECLTTMDIHLGITGAIFDDQRSSGHFEIYSERRNFPESICEETNSVKIIEDVDEPLEMGTNTWDKINHQIETEAATIDTRSKLDFISVEKDEAIQENLHDYQEQNDHQKQFVDEDLSSSDHQENTNHEKEPRVAIEVESEKSFNEILGMFKKASDERTKLYNENESSRVLVPKVGKNTLVDKKQVSQTTLDGQEINKNQHVSQKTMDHQEKDKSGSQHWNDQGVSQNQKKLEHNEEDPSLLSSSHEVDKDNVINTLDHLEKESLKTSCSEIEWAMQDSAQFEDENKQYRFYINDADEKQPNSIKEAAYDGDGDGEMIKNRLLLELVSDKAEFQFVKQVLDKSGFLLGFGEWYQPMGPLLFEEVETCFLQAKYLDSIKEEEVKINDHHLLLFDLVNEALLEIHNTTHTFCPHLLTTRSKLSPMPVGYRLLEQVWVIVNMYLSWSFDDAMSRDLAEGNGWMNLHADAEFVGMQLEELLVDDLLDELVFDDLLM